MTTNLAQSSAPTGSSPTSVAAQRVAIDSRWALGGTAIVSAVAFVLLSLLVVSGATQAFDDAARQFFRPDDVWGTTQQTFGYMVDGLSPLITAPLLAIGSTIAAWRAHSLRPLIFGGTTGSVAVALTLAAKATMDRSDGHGDLHGVATSYPSGHMVMLLITAGCLLMIYVPRARWLWVALGVVEVMMGISILIVAMHWLTDVLASVLLGVTVLALAALFRNWLPSVRAEVRP